MRTQFVEWRPSVRLRAAPDLKVANTGLLAEWTGPGEGTQRLIPFAQECDTTIAQYCVVL